MKTLVWGCIKLAGDDCVAARIAKLSYAFTETGSPSKTQGRSAASALLDATCDLSNPVSSEGACTVAGLSG
jgi:hypothetical protein